MSQCDIYLQDIQLYPQDLALLSNEVNVMPNWVTGSLTSSKEKEVQFQGSFLLLLLVT